MAQNNPLNFWIVILLLLSLTSASSVSVEQSSGVDEAEATLVRLRRAACSAGDCQNGGVCWPGPVTADAPPCLCPEPYTGAYCTSVTSTTDFCADVINPPCRNGATCSKVTVAPFYSCSCAPGFTGSSCQDNIDDCAPNPCRNGLCTDLVNDYNCSCFTGWEDKNCSIDTNYCVPLPCQNGGLCSDGNSSHTCDCSRIDFEGVNCTSKIDDCLSSPCKNKAICVDGVRSYTCDCKDTGFKGAVCEINIDDCAPNPCRNGICTDLVKDYRCSCFTGWENKNCSIDTNYCLPLPCQNGGLCSDGNSTYTCDCSRVDFEGRNCSLKIDDCLTNNCQNGGRCIDGVRSYTCDCTDTGFRGAFCEINIDDCAPNPCRNGLCMDLVKDYNCSCFTGWEDKNCSTDTNYCLPLHCQNGGLCIDGNSTFTCDCSRIDFQGPTCSSWIDDCLSSLCLNGGRCIDGVRSYSCDCSSFDFSGPNCQTRIDDCSPNPCRNGATCVDGLRDYTCNCDASYTGFGGKNCSVRLTGCDSVPCRNNSICEPALLRELPTPEHGHLCTCSPGWTGPQCNLTTLVSLNGSASFSALLSIAASSSSAADWTFEFSFRSSLTQFDLIRLSSDSGLIRVGAHNSSLVLLLLNASSSAVIGQTKWPISDSVAAADWLTLSVSLTNGSATLTRTGSSGVRQSQLVDGLSHTFKRGSVSVRVGGDGASAGGGFRGCVRDVQLATSNSTFVAMETTVESHNATWGVCSRSVQCGSPSPCELRTSSMCLDVWNDFVCQCAADFGGRNCSVQLPSFSFGLGGYASSASFASVPAVSSVYSGDSWTIELRLLTLSPGAFLMLLGDPSDSATTPRLLVTIDVAGRLSAQFLLSNGFLVATLKSPDSVATGSFVFVKIYLSISDRVMSLKVASAVRSASLSSSSPLSRPSGQLIVGGFSGAPSASRGRSKRSAPVLPASVASALPAGTTAFLGLLAALRLNGDGPLIPGAVSASWLSSLPGAVSATDSSGVALATLENNACAVYEPCRNGGTCSNVFLNSYSCQCHPGYSGTNCSTDYADCQASPCGSEEVCLEKSDPTNYNIKILPPPFNGAFSYGSAAGHVCVKSYVYWSQANSFTGSVVFYVILVTSCAVLSAVVAIAVVFLLIKCGRWTRNRSDNYTAGSHSGNKEQELTDANADTAYTFADRLTGPMGANNSFSPKNPAAAEQEEQVYDTAIDPHYVNMGQNFNC